MHADRPNLKHGPAGQPEYLRKSAYIRGKKRFAVLETDNVPVKCDCPAR